MTNIQRFFFLTSAKFIAVVVGVVLAVILHNAVYRLFGVEEGFFFILAIVVLPLYLLISVLYSLYVAVIAKPVQRKQ